MAHNKAMSTTWAAPCKGEKFPTRLWASLAKFQFGVETKTDKCLSSDFPQDKTTENFEHKTIYVCFAYAHSPLFKKKTGQCSLTPLLSRFVFRYKTPPLTDASHTFSQGARLSRLWQHWLWQYGARLSKERSLRSSLRPFKFCKNQRVKTLKIAVLSRVLASSSWEMASYH